MITPYVALGDSYSAGIGSDTAGTQCRRDGGYPVELARRLGMDLSYQACNGATVDDVLGWQVAPLGSETRLVTMTIGGNDAGFASVLIACAQPAWMSDGLAILAGHLERARGELPGRLAGLLAEVRRRAPRAEIVMADYPYLFAGIHCEPFTFFSAAEMGAINAAADEIAALLRAAAADGGADFIDVRPSFAGHEICTDAPWVHGLSWPVDNSYHPTSTGHHAYVQLLDERLRDSREARPVVVREGPRRRGSGERFRLPDLLSPQSLAGAERYGLDPHEVAELARRVPRAQRAAAPGAPTPDPAAMHRLLELHLLVRARRGSRATHESRPPDVAEGA